MLLIGSYLGVTVFFQYFRIVGDAVQTPLAYFWTWDMFPNYDCFSVRSVGVARTASGRYVRLFPGPTERFRWGAADALSRTDRYPEAGARLIRNIIARRGDADSTDRIVHAYLIEQYWPVSFNYPPPIFESLYDRPRPERRYWRVLREWDVSDSRIVDPGAGS